TRMTSEEMIENKAKWWRWLGEESVSGGIIKAADPDGYESGGTYGSNVWRPSKHSMMRWTGFSFDQVLREHMTQRITGLRNKSDMPLDSSHECSIVNEEILLVETMYHRIHLWDVEWELKGEKLETNNERYLNLQELDVKNDDIVKVTVRDQTDFVRDPEFLESRRMLQTRECVVCERRQDTEVDVKFTTHYSIEHYIA